MPDTLLLGQELITEFLTGIKAELVAYMDTDNRNASGRSKASLEVTNITEVGGQLIGADWIEFTFRGRGPGKMPPLNAIIDWCNDRGLPRSMAWPIAKRIADDGSKLFREGRNILNEIITDKKIDKFKEDLTVLFTAQIQSTIDSILVAA